MIRVLCKLAEGGGFYTLLGLLHWECRYCGRPCSDHEHVKVPWEV